MLCFPCALLINHILVNYIDNVIMVCLIFVLLAGKPSWEVPASPKSRKIITDYKLILQHMLWLVVLPAARNRE